MNDRSDRSDRSDQRRRVREILLKNPKATNEDLLRIVWVTDDSIFASVRAELRAEGVAVNAKSGIDDIIHIDPAARATKFELPEGGVDLDAIERSFVEQALVRTHWNQSQAGRLLGISRYAVRYRMEKHGFGLRPRP